MKVLGIESATITASCALVDDEKLIGEYSQSHKKTHSEKLMPLIERLLKDTEIEIKDIDIIAISKGPGSYTGLRIGAAIGKSLAHACNIPVVGVPTIDALAFNISMTKDYIVPILDARGGRIYSGIYKWEKRFITVEEQFASDIDKLIEKLKTIDKNIVLSGDGAEVHKAILKEQLGEKISFVLPYNNMPRAASTAQLGYIMAKEGKTQTAFEFAPEYLRKSQAERNLK